MVVNASGLYACGRFFASGGGFKDIVVRWDGNDWKPVGLSTDPQDMCYVVRSDGSNMLVGGTFEHAGGEVANNIARRDGSSWSGLEGGVGAKSFVSVRDIAIDGRDVYLAGTIETAGSVSSFGFAHWGEVP